MDLVLNSLSHRFPFLFVDRLIERVPGEYAKGIKNVSRNEWFFQGHFPDEAIMPGVLIVEAIAQMAAFTGKSERVSQGNGMLVSIKNIKFYDKVVPGDQLELCFRVKAAKGKLLIGDGTASVQGKAVCSLEEIMICVPAEL